MAASTTKLMISGIAAAGFGPVVGVTIFELLQARLWQYDTNYLLSVLALDLFMFPVAVFFTCVFGIPLFRLARRLRLVHWWFALCVGLVGGAAVELLFSIGNVEVENVLLRAIQCASSAMLFFWLGGRHAHLAAPLPNELFKPQPAARRN